MVVRAFASVLRDVHASLMSGVRGTACRAHYGHLKVPVRGSLRRGHQTDTLDYLLFYQKLTLDTAHTKSKMAVTADSGRPAAVVPRYRSRVYGCMPDIGYSRDHSPLSA